jgi:hypothetical protein
MATNFLINGSEFSDNFIPRDAFTTGGLWSWGQNYQYQLGDGTQIDRSSPVQISVYGNNWKEINVGHRRTGHAIKTNGTLWTWGNGGALGDGTTNSRSVAVQIGADTTWKQVDSGVHGVAIKTDGTLWAWGTNLEGQIGNGTTTNTSSPVQIGTGTNWKFISAGTYHTAAIKTDGSLWGWGWNAYGQLGDNTRDSKSSPVQTVAGGTNWKMVASGGYHTAAIKTDGTLWLWGEAAQGKLGDGTTANKSSPVQTIAGGVNWKLVTSGTYHTAAIKTDGTLWSWGGNTDGALGDGTLVSKSSPVQTVSFGTNWKQVSVKGFSIAIKTDGTLWAWGRGNEGQLGDGTSTTKSSPVQIPGTNWKKISAGGYSSVASGHAIRDDS